MSQNTEHPYLLARMTEGQERMISAIESLTEKIGSNLIRGDSPTPAMVAESPTNSNVPRPKRYVTPIRRDELGPVQSKGKETAGVPLMVGARPDHQASSSQAFVAHEAHIPYFGSSPNNQGFNHQPNYRHHYNPMFELSQPRMGQVPEQAFWPHQMNAQGQFLAP